jgi:sterol desaturase/sphingolipid hydroxylase (fatty acid hydroxylase superfamily)
VHHSDPEVDATTAIRHHPPEALAGVALMGAATGLVGVAPAAVALYAALDWTVQLIAHSNLRPVRGRVAWLGRVVVTPEFHRLHHSRRRVETDSNYGQVFAFWDLLFGTFRRAAGCIECGLDSFRDARSQSPHWLLVQPLLPREGAPGGDGPVLPAA